MELLAGGLAASGACLLTNPLEVPNSAQLLIWITVVLVSKKFCGYSSWTPIDDKQCQGSVNIFLESEIADQ
jgi:hypothetical protein